MGLDGVSAPISPVQSGPIVQAQAAPEPPENEPEVTVEEEGGGKAKGVVRKLNEEGGGHFKGKGVSDIRLRIAHFDNPELEPIDPEELSPDLDDGPSKAYEKFLDQYTALYDANQVVEPEPDTDSAADVEPVSEPDVPAMEIPETEPVIMPPLEIEPVAASEQTEPEEPIDEGDGALAAFEELLDAQASEEEAETLDVVM